MQRATWWQHCHAAIQSTAMNSLYCYISKLLISNMLGMISVSSLCIVVIWCHTKPWCNELEIHRSLWKMYFVTKIMFLAIAVLCYSAIFKVVSLKMHGSLCCEIRFCSAVLHLFSAQFGLLCKYNLHGKCI